MHQERIKDRLLRRASRLWGYSELEPENSFDPLVKLLLSSVASELEKLGFDLENSRSRMIERILELLFPEDVSGVFPSRSLIQVTPQESNASISLYDSFRATKSIHNIYNPTENSIKNIYFSPTISPKLSSCKVEYIAFGNELNKIESFFFSERLSKSEHSLPPGELWLGIRCYGIEELENLQFYIDTQTSYQKELFFYYLKQSKIYFGEKIMKFQEGYNVEQNDKDIEQMMMMNYHHLSHIYNEINAFYKPYFFTLKDRIRLSDQIECPKLFTDYFLDHPLSEEKDIVWLRIELSEVMISEVLRNVSFALNCVPVVNIHNVQLHRRVGGLLNIIPIQSEDYFLDLDYIKNEKGERLDIKDESSHHSITAMLRRGGVARFDQRNASELLQYLLELIKDETAAFSGIGGDVVSDTLKNIHQNVSALQQLSEEKNFTQTSNPYIIISSVHGEAVACDISYWLTAGALGNDIKSGTVLEVDNTRISSSLSNVVMLKSSFGGRQGLSVQDKILEYRSAMLSRGRIVTPADIKSFAQKHFKQTISNIEIKKGTKKEVANKGGFSRTIDIYLTKNPEYSLSETEWNYLCEQFLHYIENNSANVLPYRVIEVNM